MLLLFTLCLLFKRNDNDNKFIYSNEKKSNENSDDLCKEDEYIQLKGSTAEYYVSSTLYFCFRPYTMYGSYVDTIFVFGRNLTIMNKTHTIVGGFGATNTSVKIQGDEYGSYVTVKLLASATLDQFFDFSQWKNVEFDVDKFVIMKKYWTGSIETSVTTDSNENISFRGKALYLINKNKFNISVNPSNSYVLNPNWDGQYDLEDYLSKEVDYYLSLPFPKTIMDCINNDVQCPSGEFNGSVETNVQYAVKEVNPEYYYSPWYDDEYYDFPDKVVKLISNTIYGPDTFDDYRLDGIHDPLDDICSYYYIDPENPPTHITRDIQYCFKPFTMNGNYYDTIIVISDENPQFTVDFKIPNPNIEDGSGTFGATAERVKISRNSDPMNLTMHFFSSFIPSYDNMERNIEKYLVLKTEWNGKVYTKTTIENNCITSETGKIVEIFQPESVHIKLQPGKDTYYSVLDSNENIFELSSSLTNEDQEGTVYGYESSLLPSVQFENILTGEDIKNGTYTSTLSISVSKSINNYNKNIDKVIKLTNNTLYNFYLTLDDVYLDGIDHEAEKELDVTKISIILVVCIILAIIILFSVCNFLCNCMRKLPDTLDNSSSDSPLDPDIWVTYPVYDKHGKNKKK